MSIMRFMYSFSAESQGAECQVWAGTVTEREKKERKQKRNIECTTGKDAEEPCNFTKEPFSNTLICLYIYVCM